MKRLFRVQNYRVFLGLLLAAAAGCSADRSPRLADYLDELEFDVPLETAAYVPLGKYDIPIATSRKVEAGGVPEDPAVAKAEVGSVLMRLQFELTAETAPPHKKAVAEAAERHRGALNDAVLTIVRTSSIEELSDPRLAAVKARLSEMMRPMLGEDIVRQLVFNKLDAESIKQHESMKVAKDEHGHN